MKNLCWMLLFTIVNRPKMQKLPKEIYFREIHKKDDPSAYALTKFSKYVM
jgi:hypothetical protein